MFVNDESGLSLLAVVVDDLLLATKDAAFADRFNTEMGEIFDLKSLGKPSYMMYASDALSRVPACVSETVCF